MYSKAEAKQLKIEFWEGFGRYCQFKQAFKHRKDKFILYDTKLKGVELKFDITRDGAYVVLEFNGTEKLREERYEQFQRYAYIFEKAFSESLVWLPHYERESGEIVSRIYTHKTGLDIHRREHWPVFYEFMAENMQRMESVFVEIKELQ